MINYLLSIISPSVSLSFPHLSFPLKKNSVLKTLATYKDRIKEKEGHRVRVRVADDISLHSSLWHVYQC